MRHLEAHEAHGKPDWHLIGMEFGQYATASALAARSSIMLTLLLSSNMDYRLANIIAICHRQREQFSGQRPLDLPAAQENAR